MTDRMYTTTTSFEGEAELHWNPQFRIHQKVGTKFFFNYNARVNFHINEEDLLSENPSLLFFQGYSF